MVVPGSNAVAIVVCLVMVVVVCLVVVKDIDVLLVGVIPDSMICAVVVVVGMFSSGSSRPFSVC